MRICPNCGEENPERFRLCGMCGEPLAAPSAAAETRKTVTIVFSDLKGSTDLGEALDPEALREVLGRYFDRMQAILESHGGAVEKYIGDAIMAVFGLPRQREDDALRAVRSAHEMQAALVTLNDELDVAYGVRLNNRTGVNTGEVVAGDVTTGQRLVTGDAVNVAARLEQAAPVGEILLGEPTYRLVHDAVEVEPVEPLELKGKSERVPAHRLVAVHGREGVARRTDTPVVGREEEMERLVDLFEVALAERTARLIAVLGHPGVGKSRLCHAFAEHVGSRARVLRGRCLSYGEGITFWPLNELVRDAAGLTDDDPPERAREAIVGLVPDDPEAARRVSAAIGVSDESFPIEDLFWGARSVFETLASRRPLVLMVDDIHWAEATFLELLAHLVRTAREPILVLCTARPELSEQHPDALPDEPLATSVRLQPLSESDSTRIVENLLGSRRVDAAVVARVIEAAEGNPLFVEQMLSMLVDQGRLCEHDGVLALEDGDGAVIPPSISALFAARLDALPDDERTVTEHASVVGRVFGHGAVTAMSPQLVTDQVGVCLLSLSSKGLVEPDEAVFAGEEAFRFAHNLIRDAAYGRLLKRVRADLHERFAGWLEETMAGRIREIVEICGYHLEQAFRNRTELAPADDHVRSLGARAAGYLGGAGRRAVERGDAAAAVNLLRRTLALTDDDPEARLLLGEALADLGEFDDADAELGTLEREAAARDDDGLALTAATARLQLRHTTDPVDDEVEVRRRLEEAIVVLERLGDDRGLARAWALLSYVHGISGAFGDAERANLRWIDHARRSGEVHLEMRARSAVAQTAVYGPTPVPEARARVESLLRESSGDRRAQSMLAGALAQLEAMDGDLEKARKLYTRSRKINQELGSPLATALVSLDSAGVELIAGDPTRAEEELQPDYETLRAMGESNYISTTAVLLAEALYRQERWDEAAELVEVSKGVAAPDDVETQVLWRTVESKLLARRGEIDGAVALVEEAARLIGETDELDMQGNVQRDLAEVFRIAGRHADAEVALDRAVEFFRRKGNRASEGRIEELRTAG